MKFKQRTVGVTIISVAFVLVTGCNTPLGQIAGNLVTINGQRANEYFAGVMEKMNAQQQAQLQAQSPQTLQTLQRNDQLAKQQQQASSTSATGQPAKPPEAPTPLKVDDIKAMSGAGIKPDAIIDAIKESKTTYGAFDIDAAQQANPPIDPAVIQYMKDNAS